MENSSTGNSGRKLAMFGTTAVFRHEIGFLLLQNRCASVKFDIGAKTPGRLLDTQPLRQLAGAHVDIFDLDAVFLLKCSDDGLEMRRAELRVIDGDRPFAFGGLYNLVPVGLRVRRNGDERSQYSCQNETGGTLHRISLLLFLGRQAVSIVIS